MGESEELLTPMTSKAQAQQTSQPKMIEADVPLKSLLKIATNIHKLTTENFESWLDDLRVVLSVFPLGEEITCGNIAPGHPQYSSSIDEKMSIVISACIEKDMGIPHNVGTIISDLERPLKGSTLFQALRAAHREIAKRQREELDLELCKLRYQGSAKELKERFCSLVTRLQSLGRTISTKEELARATTIFVQSKVLNNVFEQLTLTSADLSTAEALFDAAIKAENIRRTNQGQGLAAQGRERRACHLCKKQGHLIKDCPKNDKSKKDTQGKSKSVKKEGENAICLAMREEREDADSIPPDERAKQKLSDWHAAFGHCGERKMNIMLSKYILAEKDHSKSCIVCTTSKQTRSSFPPSTNSVKDYPLELVHVDTMEISPPGGITSYVLCIVDDHTRMVWVVIQATKLDQETFKNLRKWVAYAERHTGRELKGIRSDNGLEFTNQSMRDWADEQGIALQTTTPYTSAQNGIAERTIRSLQDIMRANLHGSHAPESLWEHALETAAYVKCRLPHDRIGSEVPFKRWYGKYPDWGRLKPFGCMAIMKNLIIPPRDKIALRGTPGILVGYGTNKKAWRIYCPQTDRKLFWSSDVTFHTDRDWLDLQDYLKDNLGDRVDDHPVVGALEDIPTCVQL